MSQNWIAALPWQTWERTPKETVSLPGESLTNESLSIRPIFSQLEFPKDLFCQKKTWKKRNSRLDGRKGQGHTQSSGHHFDAKRKPLHWKLAGKKDRVNLARSLHILEASKCERYSRTFCSKPATHLTRLEHDSIQQYYVPAIRLSWNLHSSSGCMLYSLPRSSGWFWPLAILPSDGLGKWPAFQRCDIGSQ